MFWLLEIPEEILFSGETVVMTGAVTNINNVYDVQHGVFHVPMAGYYYFHVNVASKRGERASVDLYTTHGYVGCNYKFHLPLSLENIYKYRI